MKNNKFFSKSSWKISGRFKSWALWLAIFGLISVIFSNFGIFDKIGITSEFFNDLVNAIGYVLIAFGIVNNPTDQDNF